MAGTLFFPRIRSRVGDAANLTSRIEGLNKIYGILASAETKDARCTDFEWR
jgi:class 3 adenylate cyclase